MEGKIREDYSGRELFHTGPKKEQNCYNIIDKKVIRHN